jgi:hypothetical protein
MLSSHGEITIDDYDGTVLMRLSHTTSDVHFSARPSQRASVFNDHRRWSERIQISCEVRHGSQ